MVELHGILVTLHVAVGSVALVVFWVPVAVRKGSRLHVRAGRLYVNCMYLVAATAFLASIMVLIDPLAIRRPGEELPAEQAALLVERFRMFSLFLLMLSVLIFSSLEHGLAALRARRDAGALRRPSHVAGILVLGVLAVVVGAVGLANRELLLIIFGGLGLSAAVGSFRDTRLERPGRRALVIAHMGGLVGSGIGAYTAFFAFGSSRYLADLLPGQWQVLPWIAPAIIGALALRRMRSRVR